MKKYDIGFGHLGNGLTVWNRLEEKNNDYKTIAHIDINRNVKFYEELPENIKQKILTVAKTDNGNVSATQDQKRFATAPTLQVKKISEDRGYCREYYKNINNGNVYARQEEFKNVWKWYTTTAEGEPDCSIKAIYNIEIVGNWEEEKARQEAEFNKMLEDIRSKVQK